MKIAVQLLSQSLPIDNNDEFRRPGTINPDCALSDIFVVIGIWHFFVTCRVDLSGCSMRGPLVIG